MTSNLKSFDTAAIQEIGKLWYCVYHDALVNSNFDLIHLVNFHITRRISNAVWAEMKERVTESMNILIRDAEETK